MFELIKSVLILSLTGSITFISFLFLSNLFKNKFSASLLYYGSLFLTLLWLVPIWKIFSSDISIPVNPVSNIIQMPVASEITRELIVISKEKSVLDWIGVIYCSVSGVLLLQFLFQYIKQKQMLIKNSWEIADQDDIECLKELKSQFGINRSVQLRCSFLTRTPVLVGVFKYQIVLPNYTLQDDQLELILKHELIHLMRYDNLFKIYFELLKSIHWFNPVVYLMQKKIENICELSCDEILVSKLDLQQRKQYSLLILNLVQFGQRGPKTCSGLNQNVDLLKERLLHILQYKSSTKCMHMLFIVLISLICIMGCDLSVITNGQMLIPMGSEYEGEDNVQKSIETFSWKEGQGEDRITLIINGKEYKFKVMDNGSVVFRDKELSYYWNALAEMPKEDLPEELYNFLYDI